MTTRSTAFSLLAGALFYSISACSDPKEPTTGPEASVHPPGWADPASLTFHGDFLRAQGYDLGECRSCHGSDYSGGLVGVSCLDCHRNPGGPEACNTCHGQFAGDPGDFVAVAPPEGLDGETDPLTRAVGAHQHHLTHNSSRPASETCQECHRVPVDFDDPDHIDDGVEAEVVFGGPLGILTTEGGTRVPNPSYDQTTGSCGDSYCHGNWGLLKSQSNEDWNYIADKIEGNSASPTWTDPNTAACGTCHNLPPTGHDLYTITECSGCHDGVIDDLGTIIDKTKHVNGKVNVFGAEYPMF
jgi:hypothetical protein